MNEPQIQALSGEEIARMRELLDKQAAPPCRILPHHAARNRDQTYWAAAERYIDQFERSDGE